MIDQHQQAAIEVWEALPWVKKRDVLRSDFIMAFTLGRVSMKACLDKAELLRPDDEPKPFTPEQKQ